MTHAISSATFNSLLFSALINKVVNLCWTRLKLSLSHYFSSEWNYWGRYFEEMKKVGIFQSSKWFWNVKSFLGVSLKFVTYPCSWTMKLWISGLKNSLSTDKWWTNTVGTKKNVKETNSIQFSRSVVSDSLRPHESQHARPPCPSPTPGVHSDSCP